MSLELGYQTRGSAVVIALPDQTDTGIVLELGSRVAHALVAGYRRVAVDLSAVHHMGTQTLSELCGVLRRAGGDGSRLAIVGADERVEWVIGLCGINGLELHRTLESALAVSPAHQGDPTDPGGRDVADTGTRSETQPSPAQP